MKKIIYKAKICPCLVLQEDNTWTAIYVCATCTKTFGICEGQQGKISPERAQADPNSSIDVVRTMKANRNY